MFITKMSLPRRTFSAAWGVTLALPLLESMVPALTATAKTAANPQRRFGAVFVPLGERPGLLDTRRRWVRTSSQHQSCKPLEPFRDHRDRGLGAVQPARRTRVRRGSVAERRDPEKDDRRERLHRRHDRPGHRKQIGQDTVFPSLELATEDFTGYIGGCDTQYAART